jgi:hypothetical protein
VGVNFPNPVPKGVLMPPEVREHVFISYSHKDKRWLDKLQTMLAPLVRKEMIKTWADTNIEPGSQWKDEIKNAIASAKVAVLLVSPDFLASDFIAKDELPPILEAAEKEGLIVLWIAISASMYRRVTEIAEYQAVNEPSRPLDSLSPAMLNKELVRICEKISQAVNPQHSATSAQGSGKTLLNDNQATIVKTPEHTGLSQSDRCTTLRPNDHYSLKRLLREKLDEVDLNDIATYYGPLGRNPKQSFSTRLGGANFDAKVSNLIDDAMRTKSVHVLLEAILHVRPDLEHDLPQPQDES